MPPFFQNSSAPNILYQNHSLKSTQTCQYFKPPQFFFRTPGRRGSKIHYIPLPPQLATMHLFNILLVLPALATAAETFAQPFRSWDCVDAVRGPLGTGEMKGQCISFDSEALSLAMEKKTNILRTHCTIVKEQNCQGQSEGIDLGGAGARHACKNPSLNGFRSVSCVFG